MLNSAKNANTDDKPLPKEFNSDALLDLAKQFRKIQKAKANVAWLEAEWAAKARAACTSDAHFLKWCEYVLGQASAAALEFLCMARTFKHVGSADDYQTLGVGKAIAKLADLTPREQARTISEAKATKRTIRQVFNDRERASRSTVESDSKVESYSNAMVSKEVALKTDAALLADYVLDLKGVPAHIRAIAQRLAGRAQA